MRQSALFSQSADPIVFVAEYGDVTYFPEFLTAAEADALADELRSTTRFVADTRMMYGRRVAVPRETAGRGDGTAQPWTSGLLVVRTRLESRLNTAFDYVFVNRYRDGRDSVAWHADHDGRADSRLTIGSLSLGATRQFDLRPKSGSGLAHPTISVDVANGDLIVMGPLTQQFWEHRVRKDSRVKDERLNVTYRQRRSPAPAFS